MRTIYNHFEISFYFVYAYLIVFRKIFWVPRPVSQLGLRGKNFYLADRDLVEGRINDSFCLYHSAT